MFECLYTVFAGWIDKSASEITYSFIFISKSNKTKEILLRLVKDISYSVIDSNEMVQLWFVVSVSQLTNNFVVALF